MKDALKDWRTTVPAGVSAFCMFVLFAPEHFESVPWLQSIAAFAAAGGLALLGISAKSYRK
jgi:hypothetical protein